MTRSSWCFNGDGGTTPIPDGKGRYLRKHFCEMTIEELEELAEKLPHSDYSGYALAAKRELAKRPPARTYAKVECEMVL